MLTHFSKRCMVGYTADGYEIQMETIQVANKIQFFFVLHLNYDAIRESFALRFDMASRLLAIN